ncbi:MAG: methylmalonyl-CoA epimerase [Halobacteriovoraceae bacterium]|nr:methylmalonyl-CoA epimerase [Halobacteriovoraceae bacterium]MCB9095589.1 methylmalonyl-CoA epimerase [Halobacteriovoraceae bacterium]
MSKKTYLDHIAIAVKSLEDSMEAFQDLGIEFESEFEIVESQKVKTAFGKIDEKAKIELLEPISNDSTIAKFIEKKGEGIHHLCFRVENVIEMQKELEKKGYRFIYDKPFVGAHNCLVNFMHPKSAHGCLIEISQKLESN